MNWFKCYIGDYQRDTADLSLAEHGAYLLMLQHYYATEKPLPTDKALHRMLRATDKGEREAIDAIAARFWMATEAGLINQRADIEIGKASDQADTNRRIAQAREEARKAKRNEHDSCSSRDTKAQPNQTPDTRPPSLRSGVGRGSRLPPDWVPEVEHLGWSALQAQELPKFRDYWLAQPGQKGVKADWQATWRNWMRKAAEYAESGRTGERLSAVERTKRDSEEWARRQGGDGVLAANGEPLRPQVDERLRVVAGRSVDISPDDVGF
jgi:uncharacterized protein YdaU (DUF1376 family)